MNQSAPSGPAVMAPGWLAVGMGNSVIVMAGDGAAIGADRLRVVGSTLHGPSQARFSQSSYRQAEPPALNPPSGAM